MSKPQGGPAPFGYQWNEGSLEVKPEDAAIRLQLFELFVNHKRKGTVARLLNEAGLPSPRGGNWSDTTVTRQLTCTSAKGVYIRNMTTTDASGNRVARPQDEWHYITCEPIVSGQLWNEVAEILEDQGRAATPRTRSGAHTFTGFAFCGCGSKLVVPKDSHKYTCPDCHRKIPASDLEGVFEDELRTFLEEQSELLREIVEGGPSLAACRQTLIEAETEHDRLEGHFAENHQLLLEKHISLERYGRVQKPLEARIAELAGEIKTLRNELARIESDPAVAASSEFDLQSLVDRWPKLPTVDRRQIAKSIVSKLILHEDEIEICYLFDTTINDGAQPPNPNESKTDQFSSPKDATRSQRMGDPTNALTRDTADEPFCIRLPKSGDPCHLTGLTRSMLNELVLPTERNGENPPVRSIPIVRDGKRRGIRLIVWASLKSFLESQVE